MAGRPRNLAALNVVHRTFWESFEPSGTAPDRDCLKDALALAGLVPNDPRTISRYVTQLRDMGVLGPRDRPRFPPLYPAYLLLDLAPGASDELDQALMKHQERVRGTATSHRLKLNVVNAEQLALFVEPTTRIAALAGSFHNTLVTTRGTPAQLDRLVESCRPLGRVDLIRGLSQRTLARRGIRSGAAA